MENNKGGTMTLAQITAERDEARREIIRIFECTMQERDAIEDENQRLREALKQIVEHARPAFHGTPYRKALDAARAALQEHTNE